MQSATNPHKKMTHPRDPQNGTSACLARQSSKDVTANLLQRSRFYGVKLPFPFKLYNMLEEMESKGLENVVSWTTNGRAFRVHNSRVFAEEVMPLYFKQSKYKSFQRQLHVYGFRRINQKKGLRGPDHGAYCHQMFVRGGKETDIMAIPRNVKVGKGPLKEAGPNSGSQNEPSEKASFPAQVFVERTENKVLNNTERHGFFATAAGQEPFVGSAQTDDPVYFPANCEMLEPAKIFREPTQCKTTGSFAFKAGQTAMCFELLPITGNQIQERPLHSMGGAGGSPAELQAGIAHRSSENHGDRLHHSDALSRFLDGSFDPLEKDGGQIFQPKFHRTGGY